MHEEALTRTSSLAKETYAYDNAGRLTEAQETPAGKGCTTRLYAYEEDSNRTSLTTREPGSEGKCATEGGTVEAHSYDEADRLDDSGTTYEPFGNTTTLPAADAGKETLTATYYVDGQTARQEQGGETLNYTYDPAGRTEKTTSEGKTTASVLDHYTGPGEAVAWSSEGVEKWTRNISGIDGALSATKKSGEEAVLQLHDLDGNIVVTAAANEAATKPPTSYNSTEYGVPVNGKPPAYSWLGALGQLTELPTGATTSGGDGYVPQLGRSLQTEAVTPPGAYPNGAYAGAVYTTSLEGWVTQSADTWGSGGVEREAARQAAARKEAEEAEARARADEPPGAVPQPGEGGAGEGLCVGAKALWCDEYGVETGQLPSGTDPYFLGHGIWIAFNLHWWGLKVQINFNKEDSIYIAAVGPGTAAATFSELDPVYAALIAGAFITAGVYSVKHVEANNCIRVAIDDGVPKVGFYRSKNECG